MSDDDNIRENDFDYLLDRVSGQKAIDNENTRGIDRPNDFDFEPIPRKKFRETDFGRTITGRNKPGKIIYGVIGTGAAVATGFDVQPIVEVITGNQTGAIPTIGSIMELDLIQIVLIVIGAAGGFAITRGLIKGTLQDIVEEILDLLNVLKKAREADSPGGKVVTEEEKKLILKEAEDIVAILWRRIVRSRILRFIGLRLPRDNA